jgi:hypothetical protein
LLTLDLEDNEGKPAAFVDAPTLLGVQTVYGIRASSQAKVLIVVGGGGMIMLLLVLVLLLLML